MMGEVVILKYRDETKSDPFGQPEYREYEDVINNVLVSPATEDDIESNRPEGIEVIYTLSIPKVYAYENDIEKFRKAKIEVRGRDYVVVGQPSYFDEVNCPTEWCMSVKVARVDG